MSVPVFNTVWVEWFFVKHRIVLVQHPSYSSDLAMRNFFLFPKLKINLKVKILAFGRHY